jgi:hypothetical protein
MGGGTQRCGSTGWIRADADQPYGALAACHGCSGYSVYRPQRTLCAYADHPSRAPLSLSQQSMQRTPRPSRTHPRSVPRPAARPAWPVRRPKLSVATNSVATKQRCNQTALQPNSVATKQRCNQQRCNQTALQPNSVATKQRCNQTALQPTALQPNSVATNSVATKQRCNQTALQPSTFGPSRFGTSANKPRPGAGALHGASRAAAPARSCAAAATLRIIVGSEGRCPQPAAVCRAATLPGFAAVRLAFGC